MASDLSFPRWKLQLENTELDTGFPNREVWR